MRYLRLVTLSLLLAPSVALASTTTDVISQLAGLFYIIVGLTLTASFLFMLAGFILWLARLDTWPSLREEAIRYMEWSVATLFTLVLVLGVVEFVQTHTQTTLYIIGLLIIILVVWLLITSDLFAPGKKKEEDE